MFGRAKFDESSAIYQTKPSKLVVTINNHLADLFIHQTFSTKVFIHPLSPNISPPNFPAVLAVSKEKGGTKDSRPVQGASLTQHKGYIKNDQSTNSYYTITISNVTGPAKPSVLIPHEFWLIFIGLIL